MNPVSISFEPDVRGAHAFVDVRGGVAGSRALCGTIVMRTYEWHLLRWLLDGNPPIETPAWLQYAPGDSLRVPVDETPIVIGNEDDRAALFVAAIDTADDLRELLYDDDLAGLPASSTRARIQRCIERLDGGVAGSIR